MAKSCQTSSNSWLISRYYLRYFSCLTAIYLIFIAIFEIKTRPNDVLLRKKPSGFGEPHLEISDDYYHYHYMVYECGSELTRESSRDVDDFIYRFFETITSMIAGEYQQQNIVIGEDQRVIRFHKQIELMTQLKDEWGRRKEADIAETLQNAPYSIKKLTWLNKLLKFFE